ncbi:MAG: Tiorf59 protein [Candidatus Woesebacteria bacterium GW2011_GWA1_44_23]|uniref:Tiorf59 protein n=1 Tax=Candidatus Woesebacteria bacterium GW2011_GWA1_44_23 TaxID=1618558 RepID=A0A837IF41_9BACT|nr:MAG: Tiorf59 protein [Candidatus Woesebacteria bacterium GW2011_GWA1_44_23]
MHDNCDVRLITIDSCRYDTALAANTPNLKKIGTLRKAETSGSYTYPAHHSFFIGDVPRIIDGDLQYIPGFDQIWRSVSARKTKKPVFSLYDTPNIITHYEQIGYNVQGFGGVTFFNTHDNNNVLPKLFKNFHYFGTSENLHPFEKIPRTESVLPLGNLELIAKSIDKDVPYFLFINCPETHIPYDVPGTNPNNSYRELIKRIYIEQNTKRLYRPENLPFTSDEIKLLKLAQIRALEWVDFRVGLLFESIPIRRPTLTIVCADHGEEFGDNGRFGHAHNDITVLQVPVWAKYTD